MNYPKLTAMLLAGSLAGCATFRDGPTPAITAWPPAAGQGKSITLVISGQVINNGKEAEANSNFLKSWSQDINRAYTTSGLFTEVKSGAQPADITAEISITDKGEGNQALAFLSGFTFGVLPCKVHEGFIVQTTFKDKEGKVLGSNEVSEFADTWIQILLLPVTPSKFPVSQYKGLIYDLGRNAVIDGHAKGYF